MAQSTLARALGSALVRADLGKGVLLDSLLDTHPNLCGVLGYAFRVGSRPKGLGKLSGLTADVTPVRGTMKGATSYRLSFRWSEARKLSPQSVSAPILVYVFRNLVLSNCLDSRLLSNGSLAVSVPFPSGSQVDARPEIVFPKGAAGKALDVLVRNVPEEPNLSLAGTSKEWAAQFKSDLQTNGWTLRLGLGSVYGLSTKAKSFTAELEKTVDVPRVGPRKVMIQAEFYVNSSMPKNGVVALWLLQAGSTVSLGPSEKFENGNLDSFTKAVQKMTRIRDTDLVQLLSKSSYLNYGIE